jgi:hypothetical protein
MITAIRGTAHEVMGAFVHDRGDHEVDRGGVTDRHVADTGIANHDLIQWPPSLRL